MNKVTASLILALMREINAKLDGSIHLVITTESPSDVARYKRAIGQAMGDIFLEIMTPIMDEHPDLTPDDLRSEYAPEGFYDPR